MNTILAIVGGTIAILGTQLLVGAAFVGLGLSIRRQFGLQAGTLRDIIIAFWVGFAASNLFLLLWNFLFPVNATAAALVFVGGALGLYQSRRALGSLSHPSSPQRRRVGILLVAMAALWTANLCRGPMVNTDAGLYHLQGMLWAKNFAVVPGLANLFGPLGFNNSSLLYVAMLDVGPWSGLSPHLANGLILQVLLAGALVAMLRLPHVSGRERLLALFEAIMLLPIINLILHDWLTSLATDLPSLAMQLVMGAQAFRLFLFDPSEDSGLESSYTLLTIGILGSAAVTFKLSAAVLVALTLTWCLVRWARRGLTRAETVRTLGWLGSAVLLTGGLWCARGVILSGYPLFPTPVLGFPVEWRAPVEHAEAEYAFAAHSARASTENAAVVLGQAGVEGWLPEWWEISAIRDPYVLVAPFLLVGIMGLIGFGRRVRGGIPPFPPYQLLLPLLVSITVWFLAAPAPRYAMAIFWIAAALISAGALDGSPRLKDRGQVIRVLTFIAVLGVTPLVVMPLVDPHPRIRRQSALRRMLWSDFLLPGGDSWFYTAPLKATGRLVVTETGLRVTVPDNRCWDIPPPCTPNPAPNVWLREPNDLQSGFVVRGPWSMEDWPNARRRAFGELWQSRNAGRGQETGASP